MDAETVRRFSNSLAMVGADCERVDSAALSTAIAEYVVEPAVGVALPFVSDALESTGVEIDPSPSAVAAATTAVTPGRFAIAETGSVAVPSTPDAVEPISLWADRHLLIVPESDIYPDFDAGFDRLVTEIVEGTDSVVLATGPSATADMGALVHGAHGPKAVHVLTVIDR